MDAASEITTDVVVIGAGLTGLTTAHYLNKAKKKFLVLEQQDRAGGVIQTKTSGGFLYEEGPNTGVVGNTSVVELFDDLSSYGEVELAADTVSKRYILKNKKWEALPAGFMDAVKTPLFTFGDKLRVLGEPFRSPGKNPHENLANFVKRRLGKSFLDYAIDPFIIGVYAGDPNYLIPKYALPKLYNLEQKYGSLIGGSVKKGFEKKTELEKRVNRKVFSFKNGLGALTHALQQSVGVNNFVFGAQQIKVNAIENYYVVDYINAKGEKVSVKTSKVISTTGAYALEAMLPFVDANELAKIKSLLYTKVIECSIGFKKWEGIPLDGFGGLIPSSEKQDILGILYMSSLFKNRTPENGALLSIFIGGVRRQDLIACSSDEIKRMVERSCRELLQMKDFNPDLFEVKWHEKAIPQYGVESGERFEAVKKIESKYPGLIIGGNLRDGIGMADRINQGKELATKI